MDQTRSLLLHAVALLPVLRHSPRMRFIFWNPQEASMWALMALGAALAAMMERVVGMVVADLGLDSEKNVMLPCERLCIFFSVEMIRGFGGPYRA